MSKLEDEINDVAKAAGASGVGIASVDRLMDAPPSADPKDVLPSTRSVISVALPLDGPIQRDFLSKRDRLSHCFERKRLAQRIYELCDRLVTLLRDRGFEAVVVDVNNVYRPEHGANDITEMTEFLPDFSHRYAALAAGVGRLGWSGNLLTPDHGAMVELGTVVTSAELEQSPQLERSPCDQCTVCAAVCPVGMISKKRSTAVNVAGLTEKIALKRPNSCCWIGCTGYQGLAGHGRWSNWSPYRLPKPLPRDKSKIDALCISLQKSDPQMALESNSFTDYRRASFDEGWFFNTVCGHCRGVCWKDRQDRKENMKLVVSSGVVAMTSAGVRPASEAELEVLETPYGVHVAVVRGSSDHQFLSTNAHRVTRDMSPMDKAVFSWLFTMEDAPGLDDETR